MFPAHAQRGHVVPRYPASVTTPDRDYLWLPTRLLDTLYDTPLAIGLYVLIARRWLADGGPDGLPLSDADMLRFDPQLSSRGSLRRAIHRLERGSWVVAQRLQGAKTRYTPTWGTVRGSIKRWSKTAPSLGRGNVQTQRVSRLLLDDYLGRLLPHPKAPAQVERYQTSPAISLKDVGIYVLTLRHRETAPAPALEEARLCHQAEPLTVPPTRETLARAELTRHGMRRVGLLQVGPKPRPAATDPRSTVFFVAPTMIGYMIGHMIRNQAAENVSFEPSECDKTPVEEEQKIPTGMVGMVGMVNPPTPTATQKGGGQVLSELQQENQSRKQGDEPTTTDQQSQRSNRPRRRGNFMSIPATPSAQRLQALGARPEACIELAEIALETIEAAIADAQARPKVYDPAGWTISLLRDVRDYGWDLALRKRGSVPDNAGPSLAELQASIARAKASGTWTTEYSLDSVSDALATPPISEDTAALLRRARASGFFGPREDGDESSGDDRSSDTSPAPARSASETLDALRDVCRPAPPAVEEDDRCRPAWIAPADWANLPVLLRGVLRGARLAGQSIITTGGWQQRQLARYSGEVTRLLATAMQNHPGPAD